MKITDVNRNISDGRKAVPSPTECIPMNSTAACGHQWWRQTRRLQDAAFPVDGHKPFMMVDELKDRLIDRIPCDGVALGQASMCLSQHRAQGNQHLRTISGIDYGPLGYQGQVPGDCRCTGLWGEYRRSVPVL